MTDDGARHRRVHDVIGVGFGPSNLALAITIAEHNARAGANDFVEATFFERQEAFGWHRGMLLEDATMQVSFLKDLVTPRDPTSECSFVCYLHEQGRLTDFMNHKTLFPLRVEFHDYLEWAAARMATLVSYGSEVVDVSAVETDGEVCFLDVSVLRAGCVTTHRTRNLVVAVGLEPCLPEGIDASARVWHNAEFLARLRTLPAEPAPQRFLVVGAGQSAAEVTDYLHRSHPRAEVCAVFARYGYSPADDSPFANRIFDPAAVDDYFGAPDDVKQMLVDYHRNTNYSVVDTDLIEELYRRAYQEKVLGGERLRILNSSRVVDVVAGATGVHATLESMTTGERSELDADAIVYATGYRSTDTVGLLGAAGSLCLTGADGRVRVGRDYRVETTATTRAGIYLQGATEHTHGLGSTLLSNVAVRAGEILASVLAGSPTDRDWTQRLLATADRA